MTFGLFHGRGEGGAPEVSLGAVLWLAAAALFVLLRLAFLLNAPVGGFELAHLSGAWQAGAGESDPRFVPTLFQAATALSFQLTVSEMPARVVAFLVTATVPLALYLLRGRLGDAGALFALVFLALDGPAIVLGASASAFGFDSAVTVWLLVALLRGHAPAWALGCLVFLAGTAGPLVLPLAFAAGVTALANRRYPAGRAVLAGAIGAVVAIGAASTGFGAGWEGLVLPPFALFAAGFEQTWSQPTTFELARLYSFPLLVVGIAAAGTACYRAYRAKAAPLETVLFLTWFLTAFAWFVTSAASQNPAALVGLTLPLALFSGPMLSEAVAAVWRAEWRVARYLVPAALFAFVLALSVAMDWARAGKAGGANEQVLVAGFVILGVSSLGYIAATRAALPALLVPVGLVLAVPLFAGAFGASFGSAQEPLPSPVSPSQLRDLRTIALETAAAQGGRIVVHPSLERDITWGFRDSGTLVVASRVPETAAVVIWPAGLPRPEGYAPLAGD
ncbi:MAG: hypothetical protein C0506_10290, partial [Anaerolinea sp.]|nr:hypothetical protein [Anaerolinea sp.]